MPRRSRRRGGSSRPAPRSGATAAGPRRSCWMGRLLCRRSPGRLPAAAAHGSPPCLRAEHALARPPAHEAAQVEHRLPGNLHPVPGVQASLNPRELLPARPFGGLRALLHEHAGLVFASVSSALYAEEHSGLLNYNAAKPAAARRCMVEDLSEKGIVPSALASVPRLWLFLRQGKIRTQQALPVAIRPCPLMALPCLLPLCSRSGLPEVASKPIPHWQDFGR